MAPKENSPTITRVALLGHQGDPEGPERDLERLDPTHLRLAVRDCVLGGLNVSEAIAALWREDPEVVAFIHDEITLARMDERGVGPTHGRLADMLREAHRPIVGRSDERGLTITEAASRLGIPRPAFVALAEAHGYLELAPFGREKNRRLMSERAVEAGIGWNVNPTRTRSPRLDGHSRATVFAVFAEDRLADVEWSLDWPGIIEATKTLPTKKERLSLLLRENGHLPDTVIASLAGMERRTVAKARRTHSGEAEAAPPEATQAVPPEDHRHPASCASQWSTPGNLKPIPGGLLEWVLRRNKTPLRRPPATPESRLAA
ncbi:Hypothetical protein RMHFA_05386 [Roseomonas mucosa]|uniref:Uncharacterized protein n=1 Tax=Roseomonas mucosa TaxID=207340 RepID=A0A4Y1N379_9PROT|nr:Hypothetical protein RADP37_05386 [Roseomonas mucosa]UZO98421.1 Hypothetical protein RMHFA_05386 [Roseomonas mucosa]